MKECKKLIVLYYLAIKYEIKCKAQIIPLIIILARKHNKEKIICIMMKLKVGKLK